MIKLNKKGQSIMEYAVLVSLVIAAITGMQLYVRRGLQARIKDASDNLPNYIQTQEGGAALEAGTIFNDGHIQYEPYYRGARDSDSTTTSGTKKYIADDEGGMRQLTGQTRKITGSTSTGAWWGYDTGDKPPEPDPIDPDLYILP